MAKKTNTPTAAAEGGRPGKPRTGNKALDNLQYAVDRACNFIADGGASYAKRARSAARAEIPQETVLKGIQAMRDAVSDAERVAIAAYTEPTKRVQVSRVSLL